MRHVDEALLVAYADDALSPAERADVEMHLAACAECRARVEEERALAGRAAAVLGAGVPAREPEMPAFAEILRRSERSDSTSSGGTGARRSRSWTMPPLAWAAMLVVGLGAAIIARTLLVSPEFTATVESADEPSDAAPARSLAAPAQGEDAAADEGPTAGRAESTRQADAGAAADVDRVTAAPPPAPPPMEQRAARAAPDAAKAAVAPAAAPDDTRARPADAPPFEPSRERQRYADMVQRDSAERRAAEQRAQALALDEVVIAAATVPGAVALSSADVAWRGESLTDALARSATLTGVPAAPVTSVWLANDSAAWRARVVQQVDSTSVEIIEWRTAAASVGQGDTLADGRNALYVETGGVTFLLRAALPMDRLEALGRALQPLQ